MIVSPLRELIGKVPPDGEASGPPPVLGREQLAFKDVLAFEDGLALEKDLVGNDEVTSDDGLPCKEEFAQQEEIVFEDDLDREEKLGAKGNISFEEVPADEETLASSKAPGVDAALVSDKKPAVQVATASAQAACFEVTVASERTAATDRTASLEMVLVPKDGSTPDVDLARSEVVAIEDVGLPGGKSALKGDGALREEIGHGEGRRTESAGPPEERVAPAKDWTPSSSKSGGLWVSADEMASKAASTEAMSSKSPVLGAQVSMDGARREAEPSEVAAPAPRGPVPPTRMGSSSDPKIAQANQAVAASDRSEPRPPTGEGKPSFDHHATAPRPSVGAITPDQRPLHQVGSDQGGAAEALVRGQPVAATASRSSAEPGPLPEDGEANGSVVPTDVAQPTSSSELLGAPERPRIAADASPAARSVSRESMTATSPLTDGLPWAPADPVSALKLQEALPTAGPRARSSHAPQPDGRPMAGDGSQAIAAETVGRDIAAPRQAVRSNAAGHSQVQSQVETVSPPPTEETLGPSSSGLEGGAEPSAVGAFGSSNANAVTDRLVREVRPMAPQAAAGELPHTDVARAARQASATSAVNLMTLRRSTKVSVNLPDLGAITVEAMARRGEIDVEVLARDPGTAAILQSTRPELESQLRNSAVELRNLKIDQDSPEGEHFGNDRARTQEQRPDDQRATQGREPERDGSESGEESSQKPTRPGRVRIVL